MDAESAPPGRRQRKAESTRASLVAAAMDLFEQRGYAATSIDDITERADVARRTFFRYFPTKESVLLPEASDYDAAFAEALAAEADPLTVHGIVRAFMVLAEQMQLDDQLHRRERIIRNNREHFRSFTLLRIENGREQLGRMVAAKAQTSADDAALLIAVDLALLAFGHGYMRWFDSSAGTTLVETVADTFELTLALASGSQAIGE